MTYPSFFLSFSLFPHNDVGVISCPRVVLCWVRVAVLKQSCSHFQMIFTLATHDCKNGGGLIIDEEGFGSSDELVLEGRHNLWCIQHELQPVIWHTEHSHACCVVFHYNTATSPKQCSIVVAKE